MSQTETRSPQATPAPDRIRAPSVLVALVTRDGAQWLPQCLLSLSRQTHPRIGVLAIDNGSSDGSPELLESALGAERVVRLGRNIGFGGAVKEALASDLARRADYVLLLHDDAVLAPDAVQKLVEAARRVDGAGVVGPKILDWEQGNLLQEVGSSTDRFGYAYSPLEEGEIDQGQYDRLRDVLFVSSVAMLISRETWTKIGAPDERFTSYHEGLDYCWRARLAGFRVLMAPGAVARHRGATLRGEREGGSEGTRHRYHRERGALASILKNYSIFSLLWILPLYFAQALARIGLLVLSRRLDEAYQVMGAWGWNLLHLPDTLRRRYRVQRARRVPDRVVRRSMAPAWIRIRRWAAAAEQALMPAWAGAGEAGETVGARAVRVALAHPAAIAVTLGVLLALVSYRRLIPVSPLIGGALGAPPDSPEGYFAELASAVRHTGFGGGHPASPALGFLGVGSYLALGSPALFQKILLLALPAAAAIGCYRAVRALIVDRAASVVAGAAYGLSGMVLWAFSSGRLGELVFLAGTPWLVAKVGLAFDDEMSRRVRPYRWVVGAAAGLAAIGSFFPGAFLAAALVVLVCLVSPVRGARRTRGTVLSVAAVGLAALLILPLSLDLIRTDGAGLGARLVQPSFFALLRLSPGPAPGAWPAAAFLPVAAAIGLAFVPGNRLRIGFRAALLAVAGVHLAWASSTGYLPEPASNPIAFLGPAAFAFSLLVGLGLTALIPGVTETSFGHRHVAAGALLLVLAAGMAGQSFQAAKGAWALGGPERIPAAYPIVADADGPPFRVLWLGRVRGDAFSAPGGLHDGTVHVGKISVRYAVRSPEGSSDLDTGRAPAGLAYEALERALARILDGATRHGGALLAPFGVRFVVADPQDLPDPAWNRLTRQLDLDVVASSGLRILENPKAVPLASVVTDPEWVDAALAEGATETPELPSPQARSFDPPTLSGTASRGSMVLVAEEFDARWRLQPADGGARLRPRPAFGWGLAFPVADEDLPPRSRITFAGQGVHTVQMVVLGVLWTAAVVLTRKPARRG